MNKFTQWCIKHRLGWFIKILIILCFPLYLAAYTHEAIRDMKSELNYVDRNN